MDIDDIIEKYDIQVVSKNGDELRCLCPFHEDVTPSFSFNVAKGKWYCHAGCGGGNLKSLIMKFENCSKEEAEKILYGETTLTNVINKLEKIKQSKKKEEKEEIKRIKMPEGFKLLKSKDECPEYLLKRLNWKTIKHFKIGICKTGVYKGRVIIPVIYKGKPWGFVARDYTGKSSKRYLYPEGFKPTHFLFNYDEICREKEVILVEGVFDCMKLYEYGYSVVCTFGPKLSNRQLKLLNRSTIKSCVLCYDYDVKSQTGQIGTKKVIKKLHLLFYVSHIDLKPGIDPDSYSKEDFDYMYQTKQINGFIPSTDKLIQNMETDLLYLNKIKKEKNNG